MAGSETISFEGSITVVNCSAMRTAIQKALQSHPAELVVNFSDVTYMDSSALATLVESLRNANRQQTRLTIAGMSEQPRNLMEVTHLDRLFGMGKVETARSSFRRHCLDRGSR